MNTDINISADKGQHSIAAAHIQDAIDCLNEAIKRAGGILAFSRSLGISHQVVYQWKRLGYVPAARAIVIESKYGIPLRKMLRFELAEALSQTSQGGGL